MVETGRRRADALRFLTTVIADQPGQTATIVAVAAPGERPRVLASAGPQAHDNLTSSVPTQSVLIAASDGRLLATLNTYHSDGKIDPELLAARDSVGRTVVMIIEGPATNSRAPASDGAP